MTDQPDPTFTVVEAAKLLDVQPAVLRRWIAEEKIAATKAGRSSRIALYEVKRVEGGRVSVSAP
jgi:excisionase family DNA binding protein